ncbi:hypothetical protein SeLEV6574_g02189 [Synchytrium endobioticum]|uniref:HMG box domain-containing protein n=1 Tax=Synchytrium endobioticum TaxID=286115 RepID=A0A507D9U9_9FUNG|nr:hypothetical protein SeLEV6574_g02189 [Synchytrium endobioticum]
MFERAVSFAAIPHGLGSPLRGLAPAWLAGVAGRPPDTSVEENPNTQHQHQRTLREMTQTAAENTTANGETTKDKKRGRPVGSKGKSAKSAASTKSAAATAPINVYWSSNEGKRALKYINAITENAKNLDNMLSGAVLANAPANGGNMMPQYGYYGMSPFAPMGFMDQMGMAMTAPIANDNVEPESPNGEKKGKGDTAANGKRKRKPKDPDAPKHPLSSYMLYAMANMGALKGHGQKIGTVLGEEWRKLTPEEKKPYDEQAFQLRQAYSKELEAYKARKAAREKAENEETYEEEEEEDEDEEEAAKEVIAMVKGEEEDDDDDDDDEGDEGENSGCTRSAKNTGVPVVMGVESDDEDEDDDDEDQVQDVVPPAKKPKTTSVAPKAAPPPVQKWSSMGPPAVKSTAATPSSMTPGKTPSKKSKLKSASIPVGTPPEVAPTKKADTVEGKKKKKKIVQAFT